LRAKSSKRKTVPIQADGFSSVCVWDGVFSAGLEVWESGDSVGTWCSGRHHRGCSQNSGCKIPHCSRDSESL